jgi:hypothetical protein
MALLLRLSDIVLQQMTSLNGARAVAINPFWKVRGARALSHLSARVSANGREGASKPDTKRLISTTTPLFRRAVSVIA